MPDSSSKIPTPQPITSQKIELRAADGNRFAAFAAQAETPEGPGIVLMPDVRGLHPFYEELSARFATVGFDAVAIDYFGRTAGIGGRGDGFNYQEHVAQTTVAGLSADVQAAVDHLRTREGLADRNIFTMGFCFGGSNSWIMAHTVNGLAGVVGCYGHPTRAGRDGTSAAIDRVQDFHIPLLGLMGGADAYIPQEEVEKFDRALSKVGIQYKIVTYPGAPHSFIDRVADQYPEAAEDAWKRVLDFMWGGSYWAE